MTCVRLTDIAPEDLIAHMNDPRTAEHMPLLTSSWDKDKLAEFIAAKQSCWERDGLGHCAFLCDGIYAGWGGFEKEGDTWDLGLVLKPEYFGLGITITKKMLAFARADARISCVTFLVPPSRKHIRAITRLGAKLLGEVEYRPGIIFCKYRLG